MSVIKLCSSCNHPAIEGRRRCQKHLERYAAYQRKRYAAAKAQKQCVSHNCCDKAEKNKSMCAYHLRKNSRYVREHYQQRKNIGICTNCMKRAVAGRTKCRACLNRQIKTEAKFLRTKADRMRQRDLALALRRSRRRDRIARGQCIWCSKSAESNKQKCVACTIIEVKSKSKAKAKARYN